MIFFRVVPLSQFNFNPAKNTKHIELNGDTEVSNTTRRLKDTSLSAFMGITNNCAHHPKSFFGELLIFY